VKTFTVLLDPRSAGEEEKIYVERCEEMARSFTPLACTVHGDLSLGNFVPCMKRVVAALAGKW